MCTLKPEIPCFYNKTNFRNLFLAFKDIFGISNISLILIFTFDLFLCNNAIPLANNTPIGKKYVLDALDPTVIILTGGYYEGMYCLILVRESSVRLRS